MIKQNEQPEFYEDLPCHYHSSYIDIQSVPDFKNLRLTMVNVCIVPRLLLDVNLLGGVWY